MNRVEPQALEFDQNGVAYCRHFADTYASRDGALGQARHVFLAGNDLPRRWANTRQFVIVETGFGLGTNFLATWLAWRNDQERPQRLHFVSVEKHPLRAQDLRSPWPAARQNHSAHASANCATWGDLPDDPLKDLRLQLAAKWPLLVAGLHRMEFEDGGVLLTLALGDVLEMLTQLQLGADAFYLDGFAPTRNPRMWDQRLFRALARLARTDATAATYTCARAVREGLAENGFVVAREPGFGHKRHMLTARFIPRWKLRRHEPARPYAGEQNAIVVGAGLAGCSSAYALRRRGWRVTLLERADGPAREASALPAGLLHPLLSADDNRASRLSRAGFLFALELLRRLELARVGCEEERLWAQCGVFLQADSAQEAALQKDQAQALAWPAELAEFADAQQAAAHLGLAPRHGGIWFAHGAVVSAARWCRALIDERGLPAGAAGLACVFDFDAVQVQRTNHGWRVANGQGQCHEAPVLVLANAMGVASLAQVGQIPLQELGGRISLLRSPALSELRAGISGEGYVIPPLLGSAAVGATYEPVAADQTRAKSTGDATALAPATPNADDSSPAHCANLERLQQLLLEPPTPGLDGVFRGRRCVSRDRLPLAGTLPDEAGILAARQRYRGAHLPELPRLPGLFCLSALGSRGLSLAPLLGEHVASLITGEPAPIEVSLSAAVDPARFLLRRLR